MTRDEIYSKVQGVLTEALGVDEEEVTPTASLIDDLGAESIDFLDIVFRLEKAFDIKIPRGELFPEDLAAVQSDPNYVQNGVVTAAGLAEFKRRMPFADFTEFEKDPQAAKASSMLLNVDTVVSYVQSKLNR